MSEIDEIFIKEMSPIDAYNYGKAVERARVIEEFVIAYIKDEEQYDGCKGCQRMDDYCCIQCFRDRFLSTKQ